MEWNQIAMIATIAGINIALFSAIATLIVWAVNKLDIDVKAVCARMDKMDARFESHSARIDQLYKMFVDLLREKK